jgi:hypothetical protein
MFNKSLPQVSTSVKIKERGHYCTARFAACVHSGKKKRSGDTIARLVAAGSHSCKKGAGTLLHTFLQQVSTAVQLSLKTYERSGDIIAQLVLPQVSTAAQF